MRCITEYTIVIEDASINFCDSVIGFDGAITTGKTIEEGVENMREEIPFNLEGMRMNMDVPPTALPIFGAVDVAS